MWTHEIWPAEDPADGEIEFEKLSVGSWTDLEIIHVEDGRFFIQAVDDCNGEIDIGTADDLETAKSLAEAWAIGQIAEMLKALGADGAWMVKGARTAELVYYPPDGDDVPFSIRLQRPHERIMLIRFPTSDGGEPGITYF